MLLHVCIYIKACTYIYIYKLIYLSIYASIYLYIWRGQTEKPKTAAPPVATCSFAFSSPEVQMYINYYIHVCMYIYASSYIERSVDMYTYMDTCIYI